MAKDEQIARLKLTITSYFTTLTGEPFDPYDKENHAYIVENAKGLYDFLVKEKILPDGHFEHFESVVMLKYLQSLGADLPV